MTIKGTLETFNLRELLQMLAFNQKAGTLHLETERGARVVHVEKGRASLLAGDPLASRSLLRVIRRRALVTPDRLDRPVELHDRTGRFLGDLLAEMGLLDGVARQGAIEEAVAEVLLDLQLSSITRFEFLEGKSVGPDGADSPAVEPGVVVDGLLLDLTRKMDQWSILAQSVPTGREIYEGTGIRVDLSGVEDLEEALAERALAKVDGYRSLDDVAEESDVDRFTVLKLAAALVEAGGLRAVPVEDLVARAEDLVARGDARAAIPLLRRAVERDGAPTHTRLRLADALEQSGETAAAAAELETFAALAEGTDHPTVYGALERAMGLRPGDPVASGRVCDHYLRHRPWLRDRLPRALEALQQLIQASMNAGRPLDATTRLEAFLEAGDAPSEDLLVLADLYAAAGERRDAATALVRRAEALLADDRAPAARTLLVRALDLDPSRGDARQHLRHLEGQSSKRRHRRRVVALVGMLVLLVLGGGAAMVIYGREVDETVRRLREPAEQAVADAEREAGRLLEEHARRVNAAVESVEPDAGLGAAGEALLRGTREAAERAEAHLQRFADEMESFGGIEQKSGNVTALRGLQGRTEALIQRARVAVGDVRGKAEEAVAKGEKAFEAGRFEEARAALRAGRNLSASEPSLRNRAVRLLEQVDRYLGTFATSAKRQAEALARGDVVGAYRAGIDLLAEQYDSDVTRGIRLPVRVTSSPAGAEVWCGGKPTGLVTPCVLQYSPFEETELRVRLPGRTPWLRTLPGYRDVQTDKKRAAAWDPVLEASLPAGPSWRLAPPGGAFSALWSSAGVPLALTSDGARVVPVDFARGRLGLATELERGQAVRAAGTVAGHLEWRVVGKSRLEVRTANGNGWTAQTQASVSRPPAVADGVCVVVDDAGTLYAFRMSSGSVAWTRNLGSPPAQPPYASRLGFLLAGQDGTPWVAATSDGALERLSAPGSGRTFALPLGDGAVLLGGGGDGFRRVGADRVPKTLGAASPSEGRAPYVDGHHLAWIEAGGAWYASAEGEGSPVAVPALGRAPVALAGEGSVLYAVDDTGTLRAVDARDPTKALWEAPTGGKPASGLILAADAVLLLVDGAVVAVQR